MGWDIFLNKYYKDNGLWYNWNIPIKLNIRSQEVLLYVNAMMKIMLILIMLMMTIVTLTCYTV